MERWESFSISLVLTFYINGLVGSGKSLGVACAKEDFEWWRGDKSFHFHIQ